MRASNVNQHGDAMDARTVAEAAKGVNHVWPTRRFAIGGADDSVKDRCGFAFDATGPDWGPARIGSCDLRRDNDNPFGHE